MTRQSAPKIYANFTGGLVTEANKLSYPENAAVDMDNLDINENGSVQRRAGLGFDGTLTESLPATTTTLASTATTSHKWRAVNGNPDLNIAVIQVADRLDFYYVRDEEVLSTTPAAASITLTAPSRPSASTITLRQQTEISTASGGGKLFVVGKYIDPFSLEFTEPATEWDTGTIEKTDLVLKIRDFEIAGDSETIEGTDLTLDGSILQNYMSGAHFYNLANQGYPYQTSVDGIVNERISNCSLNSAGGAVSAFPASYTFGVFGVFPTTQNLFHQYQAGLGVDTVHQLAYSPWQLSNGYFGTSNSPRGRIIQEAFYLERKALGAYGANPASGVYLENITLDETISSNYRPSAVAFYAGRIWYAGLEGTRYTNNLYYSQVLGDSAKNAEKCYQEADPTAEAINDLVATDGGVLGLEEVGKIYKMAPIGPSLVIIADNGVWVVSGDGEVSSFRADSFAVRKVSDQGAANAGSVVFAKDTIYYWGDTSITAVLTGQQGGVVAQDISSSRIKELYQRTSSFAKQGTFSVFDEGSNKVLWFYADDLPASFTNLSGKAFNKVLYFDVSLGAFGKHTLSIEEGILPVSAFSADVFRVLTVSEDVTDSGITVTAGGEDVTITEERFIKERSSIKVLTLVNGGSGTYSYRFSDFRDVDTFADWGTDYQSYVEGGFDSLQDIIGKGKKAPFLQVHLERTETGFSQPDAGSPELVLDNQSSCLCRYAWDWADSPYSNPLQTYKLLKNYTPESVVDTFSYNRDVVSTRNRLRGRGTSLGLRFESEAGKDFRLLGYGVLYSGRNRP